MDAAYQVQKGVYSRLTAALTGVGIYDRVPPQAPLPYVEFGGDQLLGADREHGGDFVDAHVEVRVFARTMAEVKSIGAQIVTALNQPLPLDVPLTCDDFEFEQSRYWDDGDEVFTGMIVVKYLIQTAD